ncbi:peptidylprolyl isomerase [Candidatus Magnetobacterium casense]|uniref:Peptidylprolyl isomerase n=1 Tax=Candidatus Magnetobacterium casense TaxID=1455061 RepID=A0ABS6RX65_9BACT|nr:peptidylprolyl isomerase [Candidatus Magnetobacterium casensis]MBV6341225.1 peptidylprolyl isomerase [Candidatus Magnetobacterium casensis]
MVIEIKNQWQLRYMMLFLVLLFNSTEAGAMVLDRVVAVIDKEVITWGELYRAMEFDMRDELKNLSGSQKAAFMGKHEREFLDTLIDIKVQLMYAEGHNIGVSKSEVDAAIEDIRRKYSLSEQDFFEVLKKEGFSVEEYKQRLSEQILLSKLGNSVVSAKVIVSEDEITQRLKNKRPGTVSSQYRIRLILISKMSEAGKDKPAGEGPALKKMAEDVYGKLLRGEDFGKLAALYSDGPNASNGGDLGFISKEEMDKDFLANVEPLNQGQFSKIFVTDKGMNIVQLVEKKEIANEGQARDEVRRDLFAEKSKRAFRDWIKSLKEKRFIKVML